MSDTTFIIEPGQQDIVIERVYNAPRELVFKALTTPELIPSWWGPAKYPTTVEEMDVQPGGKWRFVSHDIGDDYGFHGVYHAIEAPQRIVQTFEFEGTPGHVQLETLTLTEVEGGTQYRAVSVFQSVEDRDAMVSSGMETGARETMDRLERAIETLR